MMSFLKELCYIRKSDRRVILFLLTAVTGIVLVFHLLGSDGPTTPSPTTDTLSWKNADTGKHRAQRVITYNERQPVSVRLAVFDPNTADSTTLLQLGLSPWQVRSIYRYRAKGGIFRKPSDFAKLYGLTVKQYRELLPYIRISDDYRPAATLYGNRVDTQQRKDSLPYRQKLKSGERIALNLADTTALMKVPGIGSYWAKQITGYRQRLGGFYRVTQLAELDGFPVDALSYFEVKDGECHRLNINRLSLNELKRHPYIGFFRAKAITDYRRLKGNLKSLSELKLHKAFTPDVIERLEHYVTF